MWPAADNSTSTTHDRLLKQQVADLPQLKDSTSNPWNDQTPLGWQRSRPQLILGLLWHYPHLKEMQIIRGKRLHVRFQCNAHNRASQLYFQVTDIGAQRCGKLLIKSQTFVAKRESPFLARLDVGDPQVVIVDEGYEVGISRTDLWVHACPWALGLDLHWLYRSRLLNTTETIWVKGKVKSNENTWEHKQVPKDTTNTCVCCSCIHGLQTKENISGNNQKTQSFT